MRNRPMVIAASVIILAGLLFSQGAITGFFARGADTKEYSVVDFPVQHSKTLRGIAMENGVEYQAEGKIVIKFDPVKSTTSRSFDKVTPAGSTSYFLASWSGWGPSVTGTITFNGKEYLIDSTGSSSSFSSSESDRRFGYMFSSTGVTLGSLSGLSTIQLSGENGLRGSDNLPRVNGNEKVTLKITGPVTVSLEELSIPLP